MPQGGWHRFLEEEILILGLGEEREGGKRNQRKNYGCYYLSAVSFSTVSVIWGQLWLKIIQWQIPEIKASIGSFEIQIRGDYYIFRRNNDLY